MSKKRPSYKTAAPIESTRKNSRLAPDQWHGNHYNKEQENIQRTNYAARNWIYWIPKPAALPQQALFLCS